MISAIAEIDIRGRVKHLTTSFGDEVVGIASHEAVPFFLLR